MWRPGVEELGVVLGRGSTLLTQGCPAARGSTQQLWKSVLGVSGLAYNSQKLCQALIQGETQSHENRRGRRSSENSSPSLTFFTCLGPQDGFGGGGTEVLRKLFSY